MRCRYIPHSCSGHLCIYCNLPCTTPCEQSAWWHWLHECAVCEDLHNVSICVLLCSVRACIIWAYIAVLTSLQFDASSCTALAKPKIDAWNLSMIKCFDFNPRVVISGDDLPTSEGVLYVLYVTCNVEMWGVWNKGRKNSKPTLETFSQPTSLPSQDMPCYYSPTVVYSYMLANYFVHVITHRYLYNIM